MDHWQQEQLAKLLNTEAIELEEGRIYTSSATYGTSRYHIINRRYDNIQIEQSNVDDKWGSRVNLHQDELPLVLASLLRWYLEDARKHQEDEHLGDLEGEPF